MTKYESHHKYRLVIVAGEASGDLHSARLVEKLNHRLPNQCEIAAIGGKHLSEAGAYLIHDLAQYGVTGLSEVVRHASQIRQAYKKIQAYLRDNPPDLLILVDYPGFNLRLAKYAKSVLKLPILYYISPQIWAWKAKRIEIIRNYIDHMAVILPFEKEIYTKANIPCSFVGHPLLHTLPNQTMREAREQLNLPTNKRIIALLPGSRQHEIQRLFPIMLQTALTLYQTFPDLHFVVPRANTLSQTFLSTFVAKIKLPITFIPEQAALCMIASDAVVVASGTASLECSLLMKPMCIIYKTSKLTYTVASQFIRVKYLGLCNLMANKMIVPELLQRDCTSKHIASVISQYLNDPLHTQQMVSHLRSIKDSLTISQADCELTELVECMLSKKTKTLD